MLKVNNKVNFEHISHLLLVFQVNADWKGINRVHSQGALEKNRLVWGDILHHLFKNHPFKKKIWNMGKGWAVDAIALSFSKELDFIDCSIGFGEIRFLK